MEPEEKFESREGRVLDFFPWKEGEPDAVIRYARKEDADGLAAVDMDRAKYRLGKYRAENYRISVEDGTFGNRVKKDLEKSLERPDELSFIVLDIGGEIVGYSEFGPKPEWGEGVICVHTTSVLQMNPRYKKTIGSSEEKGYGLGTKLRAMVISEAKKIPGAQKLQSSVHEWNIASLRSWEKLGSFPLPKSGRINNGPKGDPVVIYDSKKDKMIVSKVVRMSLDLKK